MVIAILNILGGLSMFGVTHLNWSVILGAITSVAAGVGLLYGAIKYQQTPTIIYLIFSMISIVLCGITAIILFIGAGEAESAENKLKDKGDVADAKVIKEVGWIMDVVGVVYIIAALLKLYFWLCVFSFLKELKSGTYSSPA